VLSLSKRTHDSLRAFSGKEKFQQVCAACHGSEGKGNQQLGAPNLTSEVALHGMGESGIKAQIMKGSVRTMPAHREVLSAARIHLLTAYVYSLSLEKK
jgi:cytochrome c oxidase cbb3-type subunit 3